MDLDAPERNAAGPERPPDAKAHKEREAKDDGRYIIFYSFGDAFGDAGHDEDDESVGEGAP